MKREYVRLVHRPKGYKCTNCKCTLTVLNCFPSTLRKGCGTCRNCANANNRKWANKNRDLVNTRIRLYKKANLEKQQESWLRYKYNLTLKKYNSMLEKQNNVCAICKKPERTKEYRTLSTRRLAVDHCHKTNKVRGLLCTICNRNVGIYENEKESIKEYLKCHI